MMKAFNRVISKEIFMLFLAIPLNSYASQNLSGELFFSKRPPKQILINANPNGKESADYQFHLDASFNQKNKEFMPFIQVVGSSSAEGLITIKNEDDVAHNVYMSDGEKSVFDTQYVNPGKSEKKRVIFSDEQKKNKDLIFLGKNDFRLMQCKIHPFMKSWLVRVHSSFYSIVDLKGKRNILNFKLDKFLPFPF